MKLALFGATGRTGRPLVEQALAAGHEVVALVLTPAKMPIEDPHLTLLQGDVLNAADVEKTVQGADAVISVIGRDKHAPPRMHETATRLIVDAMKKYGVRRLVSLTGAGVPAPQDRPKLFNHLITFALKVLSGEVLSDAKAHAAVIQRSGLDWVIVRGPMLTEGPRTGKYRVGGAGVNTGSRISRADLADFLLQQVSDTPYLQQMPMISE